jgi:hypothetical protein
MANICWAPLHGLPTLYALTDLVGSGLGHEPMACSLLQFDSQFRFGDTLSCTWLNVAERCNLNFFFPKKNLESDRIFVA